MRNIKRKRGTEKEKQRKRSRETEKPKKPYNSKLKLNTHTSPIGTFLFRHLDTLPHPVSGPTQVRQVLHFMQSFNRKGGEIPCLVRARLVRTGSKNCP